MKSELIIEGARQNNLRNVSVRIPHDALTVVTGLSGSGKSSLAFDTIFAEGQWRFMESLSTYAQMFIQKLDRPDVDALRNVRPAIALEQRNPVRTSRSTVGTVSEVYDYLRLLFARIGRIHCPTCGREIQRSHPQGVADELLRSYPEKRIYVLFRVPVPGNGLGALLLELQSKGFNRVRQGEDIVETGSIDPHRTDLTELSVLLDRLVLKKESRSRLTESIETGMREGRGEVQVDILGEKLLTFSSGLACTACGRVFEQPQPILFSFNHPLGACPACNGFGNILRFDENLLVPDPLLSLKDGAIEPWTKPSYRWWMRQMLAGARKAGIDMEKPYRDLTKRDRKTLFKGTPDFYGIDDFFEHLQSKRYKLHVRVFLSRYRSATTCPVCTGSRLKPEALSITIGGLTIAQASALPVERLRTWFRELALSDFERRAAKDILLQLDSKLAFFLRVGLAYLTIDRQTRTLSGGEAQRVNLSNQLALKLTGTLYVLDEPSIGLHPSDTDRLAGIVRELAASGNTVLMVEHDKTLIRAADHVIEMGPGAGERGGRVVFEGPQQEFAESGCLTAQYLNGAKAVPLPMRRRQQDKKVLEIRGASGHNLKGISVRIPLRTLVCVTGVSGSGKSTLVQDTLFRALARMRAVESDRPEPFRALTGAEHVKGVRMIDQEPIGKSARSNPVTYVKAFDLVRKLFSGLPDAKRRKLTPGHFSFNMPGGRCPACEGAGMQRIEMYFFEDIYVTCEQCGGRRYKREVLGIRYKGRNISDVLAMTVNEAISLFEGLGPLQDKLRSLSDVGLGYLRLGQPATTLSGGESQRLKISRELGDWKLHDMVYILDEPTTGLHMDDVKKLVDMLGALVNAGNTVIVVEHNMDVIKNADWVIDLGPGGGEEGGRVVAQGTPEHVSLVKESLTGAYLRKELR